MSQCPSCNAELKEDFGVAQCDACGAAVIIEIDGSVKINSEQEQAEETPVFESEAAYVGEGKDSDNLTNFTQANFSDNSVYQKEMVTGEVDKNDILREEVIEESVAGENLSQNNLIGGDDELIPLDVEADESGVQDLSEISDEGEPTHKLNDLAEIADFANSDIASGREGSLKYDLLIRGIDSSEIREAIKESLSDPKYLWDSEEIMSTIKGGALVIKGLSPVKAFMFIQTIRGLPVEISWEQHEIHL